MQSIVNVPTGHKNPKCVGCVLKLVTNNIKKIRFDQIEVAVDGGEIHGPPYPVVYTIDGYESSSIYTCIYIHQVAKEWMRC